MAKSSYAKLKEELDSLQKEHSETLRQLADQTRVQFALMCKCDELEDEIARMVDESAEYTNQIEHYNKLYEDKCEAYRNLWNEKSVAQYNELHKIIDDKDEEISRWKKAYENMRDIFMKEVDKEIALENQVAWLLKYNPLIRPFFKKKLDNGDFKEKEEE